jgi:hypothetical protein
MSRADVGIIKYNQKKWGRGGIGMDEGGRIK